MPPLQRTLSFAEMDHITKIIAEQLHFNMPWSLDEFLEVDRITIKGRSGFSSCCVKTMHKFFTIMGQTHAFSAPTGAGLDDHRITNFLSNFDKGLFISNRTKTPWNHWHSSSFHSGLCPNFITQKLNLMSSRSNENKIVCFAHFSKESLLT